MAAYGWLLTPVLFAAYLALFYGANFVGEFSRGEVLVNRTLLLDEGAGDWFGQPREFSLADRLPVLALTAAMLAWAACAGGLLLRICGWSEGLTRAEAWLFSLPAGLNAVSLFVLLAGLAGQIGRWTVFAPAMALTAGTFALIRRRAAAPLGAVQSPEPDCVSRRLAWLGAPFLALVVLGGMLPSEDFDVLEYHLQAPKEFFLQGRIDFVPHNVYANMPLGVEMFSLLGMSLADDWRLGGLAGKLMGALYVPLTALSLWAAGKRWASGSAGLIAGLIYLSIPLVVQSAMGGLIDAAAALFWWQAWYAFALWRDAARTANRLAPGANGAPAGDGRRLGLAAWLAGGAVACKYPGALFVAAPLLLWTGWATRADALAAGGATGRDRRGTWPRLAARRLAVFFLVSGLSCGPWLAKNWALAVNPVYPLLGDVLGGRTRTAAKNEQWSRAHRPAEFSLASLGRDLERVLWSGEFPSPLVVPLAAAACIARRKERLTRSLAAYTAFVFVAWWLATHRIDRFWLPALPFLSLLAGLGAAAAAARAKRLLVAFLVLGMAANFVLIDAVAKPPLFVSLDRLRNDPQRIDHWTRAFNSGKIEVECVLYVGKADVYNVEPRSLYNTVFDDCLLETIGRDRSPAEIRQRLKELGVSHVLVDWSWIERYRARGNYGFTDFVTPGLLQRWVDQGVLLPPLPRHRTTDGRELVVDVYPVPEQVAGPAP